MNARRFVAVPLALAVAFPLARADVVTTESIQVGGFFDGGIAPMNLPSHQNYFVGYGTTPGFGRTPERRSFFWFHIPDVPGEITHASLKLHLLVPTSLIFGLGPGDPPATDPIETFQLGATLTSPETITSTSLSSSDISTIFGAMDDFPIASPKDFLAGFPPPIPTDIDIPLDATGIMALKTFEGADLVLTGWMPTWSHDDRMAGGSFLEASELIFGFSDVTGPSGALVAKPTLTIAYDPVPEPASSAGLALGLAWLRQARRRSGPRS